LALRRRQRGRLDAPLAGWKSRQMVDRYAKSTADRRAREADRRMSLGDRI
jgi:hypothetical protein